MVSSIVEFEGEQLTLNLDESQFSIRVNVLAKFKPPVKIVLAKYADIRAKVAVISTIAPSPEMAKNTNRLTINGARTANRGLNTSLRSC
jgi:hypothetical protein